MAIYPVGIKGSQMYQAFSEEWLAQGGNILERMSYVPRDNYVKALESALQVDRSKQRAQILQRQLGMPLEFTPRRRKDIDVVFLAAKPEAARSLKPMLAFHYAGDVPVLSTSQVFSGHVQAHKDRDLNGIVYTEMPWFLDRNNQFWVSARETLRNGKTMQRMFAFGIDAFELSNKLSFLQENPEISIPGATGKLSMNNALQIDRQLAWAQISRGQPRIYHFHEDE
jgi:outer membrane PBP1 activator LpoA protein